MKKFGKGIASFLGSKIFRSVHDLLHDMADYILPRHCLICGRRLSSAEEFVCSVCFLYKPFNPLFHDNRDNYLSKLFYGAIPIEKAQAIMRFRPNTDMANIIYSLKYNNNPDVGVFLGRVAAKILSDSNFFDGIDYIVPMPLTKKRRSWRGYNQCERIANGVSEVTGIPIDTHCVSRMSFHCSQTHLDYIQRQDNVQNNFKACNTSALEGKHILIIDDIVTTGATVKSCGREIARVVPNIRISVLAMGFASAL